MEGDAHGFPELEDMPEHHDGPRHGTDKGEVLGSSRTRDRELDKTLISTWIDPVRRQNRPVGQ
jgi:hypothetical protein